MGEIVFYVFSALSVIGAFLVLVRPGALAGAIALLVCVLAMSGLMATLEAPYVGLSHMILFGGSSIVMILFSAIMSDSDPLRKKRGSIGFGRIIAAVGAFYLAILLAISIMRPPFMAGPMSGDLYRSVYTMGRTIASGYLPAVTIVAIALCTSIVSVVAIVKYGLGKRGV